MVIKRAADFVGAFYKAGEKDARIGPIKMWWVMPKVDRPFLSGLKLMNCWKCHEQLAIRVLLYPETSDSFPKSELFEFLLLKAAPAARLETEAPSVEPETDNDDIFG